MTMTNDHDKWRWHCSMFLGIIYTHMHRNLHIYLEIKLLFLHPKPEPPWDSVHRVDDAYHVYYGSSWRKNSWGDEAHKDLDWSSMMINDPTNPQVMSLHCRFKKATRRRCTNSYKLYMIFTSDWGETKSSSEVRTYISPALNHSLPLNTLVFSYGATPSLTIVKIQLHPESENGNLMWIWVNY